MAWTDFQFITLSDLYIAYRKAKVDMFYERDHAIAFNFNAYEEKLGENLHALHEALNSPKPNWFNEEEFVGGFRYVPKSLDSSRRSGSSYGDLNSADLRFVSSNPDAAWRAVAEHELHRASFRIIGRHPVNFHVLSALWIQKVGYQFDGALKSCAYGSRLRRAPVMHQGELRAPSRTSMGSFSPYAYGFKKWRASGLTAIRSALESEKSVIAVTADLRRFYHNVSPDFLLNEDFQIAHGIRLSPDQSTFTEQLVNAIYTWAKNTPLHEDMPSRGIPVGLSAPRVIANALLVGFDEFVQRELSPLYYGRYVDDVLLVLDNQRGMKSADDVWSYMIERSKGMLEVGRDGDDLAYFLHLPYSPKSRLLFAGDKQKVFALSGTSGKAMLESISRTVAERSSDWRYLPDLPGDSDDLGDDLIVASRDAREEADNLRKSDGISLRRLAFALRLRNLEAVQRDLLPEQWLPHREKFYALCIDHMLTVPGIFAYGPYLARLVGLAVACRDWDYASTFIKRLISLFRLIEETAKTDLSELESARHSMLDSCLESAVKALHGVTPVDEAGLEQLLNAFDEDILYFAPDVESCRSLGERLYQADLAREAYRDAWLEGEIAAPRDGAYDSSVEVPEEVAEVLHLEDAREFLRAAGISESHQLPRAIIFPTRPLTPAEISMLDQGCLTNHQRFMRWVRAIRGSGTNNGNSNGGKAEGNFDDFISVPLGTMPSAPLVAVPCFKTNEESWIACVAGTAEPDPARYFRLNNLVNDVIKSNRAVQYLLLPELALPRRWFNRLAHKLAHSQISLIAGLEYLHHGLPAAMPAPTYVGVKGFVSNQVRASLVTDVLGYSTHVIYTQEKERPAPEEETNLRMIAGKLLVPKAKVSKPVIRHGFFHFGILICSELTNINLRSRYRGRIDALFVPQWNKDINSFSSFVEATALDIHCYVVQVNNRTYGDCRIRAPYSEPYLRDVVRVIGGETDYFAVGRIDAFALRAFQSNFRSPLNGPFKPLPDGFELDPTRAVRPNPN